MSLDAELSLRLWRVVSRLGEAQILLPATLAMLGAMAWRPEGRGAARAWSVALTLAAALTLASKLAFIGWGLGSAALDFTGVSGHAMFAAAIYPLFLLAFVPAARPTLQRPALAVGTAVALLVACSRVPVGAHSWSEVVAGIALGGIATASTLPRLLRARRATLSPWWLLPVLTWLAWAPALAPPSRTHSMVTWMALKLSGQAKPFVRQDLHRARGQAPASAP